MLTVRGAATDGAGLRLSPGIRLSETKDRPAISRMTQGARLELRRPDSSVQDAVLVTYGVSVWRQDDGTLVMYGDPSDPEIEITVSPGLTPDDVPPGTEVWLLEGD
jgi:hypothetical protein